VNLGRTITALLSSLLLAAAALSATATRPTDTCGSDVSCPCARCDCCVDAPSESAAAPVAVPVAANPQVEWLALAASFPNWPANPAGVPNSLSIPSLLSQYRSPLHLFERYCALLI